ncbi:MAG: hypothetical protein ACFCD0_28455 [Gemmataceae bacterium]
MTAWKCLAVICLVLVFGTTATAQAYLLAESVRADQYHHYQIRMELDGKLTIQQDDEKKELKQQAQANHEFAERVLETGKHNVLVKTARYYQNASATIQVRTMKATRTLRPEHRLLVAQRTKDGLVTFSPKGPLTHAELDVTKHFDTHGISGLLPGRKVSIGDTWKLHNAVVQSLCYFDGLTKQGLTCKLTGVRGDVATVAVEGPASGIVNGAAVNLKIDATYAFSMTEKGITSITWTQNDQRDPGPVSPSLEAIVKVSVQRRSVDAPVQLSDIALVPVPRSEELPERLTNLEYVDLNKRFRFYPSREWIIVARTKQHLVMRILDRGAFVAQATIASWPKAKPGEHTSPEDFQTAMQEMHGWEPEETDKGEELKAQDGYYIYRLSATGKLYDLNALQYFYLVTGPEGDQLVVSFTMPPADAQKLGAKDYDFVRSIRFGDVESE